MQSDYQKETEGDSSRYDLILGILGKIFEPRISCVLATERRTCGAW